MQVTPINNNTNFNGSRGKSFNRFAKRVFNINLEVIKDLTPAGKLVNLLELRESCKIFDEINKNVDSFMSKLHPNTKIVYEKGKKEFPFSMQNPIGRCDFKLSKVTDGKVEDGVIYLIRSIPDTLSSLADFAKDLSGKVKPKDVEKAIFENAIDKVKMNARTEQFWLDRLLVRLHINAIFKYKDKVGVESEITKESLLKEVNQKFLDHKIARDNAKEVERIKKQNKKTVDRYKS